MGGHHLSGYSALYDLVSIGAFRNAEIDRVSRSSCGERRSTRCVASIAMRVYGNYGIKSIQFSIK
jgi:hypothetical protein